MPWLMLATTTSESTTSESTAGGGQEQTYLGLGFITTLLVVIWLIRRTRA